ncbi:hypothetical protein NQD34_003384 [Periophthalmus magnuspinnatus]|nr:hypothetical protein NQD34_003384 [Periophthalmus magnuspinnatus]
MHASVTSDLHGNGAKGRAGFRPHSVGWVEMGQPLPRQKLHNCPSMHTSNGDPKASFANWDTAYMRARQKTLGARPSACQHSYSCSFPLLPLRAPAPVQSTLCFASCLASGLLLVSCSSSRSLDYPCSVFPGPVPGFVVLRSWQSPLLLRPWFSCSCPALRPSGLPPTTYVPCVINELSELSFAQTVNKHCQLAPSLHSLVRTCTSRYDKKKVYVTFLKHGSIKIYVLLVYTCSLKRIFLTEHNVNINVSFSTDGDPPFSTFKFFW